jgi:hypothetical protein
MGINYIIDALCPRTDEIQRMDSQIVAHAHVHPLSSFLVLTFLHSSVTLHPRPFASHGGERIQFTPIFLHLNLIAELSQALLDFSREFDITLMDNVVMALYSGSGGKDVSVPNLRSCASVYACYLPSSLATSSAASPHSIPRTSRCLDTSTRHHGAIIVFANQSTQSFAS